MNDSVLQKKIFDTQQHNYLQDEEVVFAYKGATSSEIFNCLLSLTEEKLSILETQGRLRRKVYVIVVEALQNIYHHFNKNEISSKNDTILFLLSKDDTAYYIVAGNYISSEQQGILKEKIDGVNALTTDEIKAKYREILSEGDFSEKGGAGLGIIDIARKSGEKIGYEFKTSETDNIFFSLQVRITL